VPLQPVLNEAVSDYSLTTTRIRSAVVFYMPGSVIWFCSIKELYRLLY